MTLAADTVSAVDASAWINLGLLVATAAATVVTVISAVVAHRDRADTAKDRAAAEKARDESLRLSRQATESFDRQATALERANELIEASTPKPDVRWVIQQVSTSRWMATNNGDAIARGALLEGLSGLVRAEETVPRDVMPGDSLYFFSHRTMGGDMPRVRLSCTTDGREDRATNEFTLP